MSMPKAKIVLMVAPIGIISTNSIDSNTAS